ncbi:MAG: class I SAM-dependent methyltransferase [bacterium]|nr:class I SAM-dependent methyltransferase [bacterium]
MPNSERSSGRRFDHDYGVTTHAVLFLTDLEPEAVGDAGAHATHYEAVPVAEFRALLAHVPSELVARATFVDIGAGMGRAMLLASTYPFRQVCGIEVSPSLYEIAKENLANARVPKRRCKDLRLTRDDARIWHYPPGDLVVFLFNPFDAEALRPTLASILGRREPGVTWIVYHTPVERAEIERIDGVEIVAEERFGVVYALPKTSRSFCE